MKKILSSLLISAILVSNTLPVIAINSREFNRSENSAVFLETENEFLPNVIFVENGIPRRITKAEYTQIMANPNQTEITSSTENQRLITFDKFTGSMSDSFVISKRVAVTAAVSGGSAGATLSYGETATVLSSFSVSLTSNEINTIAKSAGISYTKSVGSNKSFGAAFTIPAGKVMKVYFTPYMKVAVGKLQKYAQSEGESTARPQGSPKNVTAYFVKKVGNFADGLYECK